MHSADVVSVATDSPSTSPVPQRQLVSAIIPTVGTRPGPLEHAVMSVLRQESPFDVEVIVVNDSGSPLSAASWQELDAVRIASTGRGWTGLPNARNYGAAAARGDFLYFLDDDDEVKEGAFAAFAEVLRGRPDAEWIHGVTERWSRNGRFIDTLPVGSEGNVIAELFSGEWMPVQAALIRTDLFRRVGGFDISFRASEDMDFMMRVSLSTDKVHAEVPVCRYHQGREESVARRDLDGPCLFDAYEKVMDRPNSLSQLRDSARTPHLYGKVLRVYLISLKRHAGKASYAKLISRSVETAILLGGTGRYFLHRSFWQALLSSRSGMKPPKSVA